MVALILGLLLDLNPLSASISCDGNSHLVPGYIPVEVVINSGVVRYNTNRDRQYLTKLFNSVNTARKGWNPAGLTVADFGFSFGLSVKTWQLPSKLFCTELNSVEANFGYNTIDVYIDRKYKFGSCQYNSILDHEMLHLNVFQETLKTFAPSIRTKLRETIDRIEPVVTSKSQVGLDILQSRIENTLKPLIKKINKVLIKRNAELDTLEKYRKEQKNCSSW